MEARGGKGAYGCRADAARRAGDERDPLACEVSFAHPAILGGLTCQDGRVTETDETPGETDADGEAEEPTGEEVAEAGDETVESKTAKIATDPRLLAAAKAIRKALPGDSNFGDDPLSTAGEKSSQQIGRRLSEATAERPSVLREAGLTALQVWDAMGQTAGRIPVKADLTILFTDLVEFSNWS